MIFSTLASAIVLFFLPMSTHAKSCQGHKAAGVLVYYNVSGCVGGGGGGRRRDLFKGEAVAETEAEAEAEDAVAEEPTCPLVRGKDTLLEVAFIPKKVIWMSMSNHCPAHSLDI